MATTLEMLKDWYTAGKKAKSTHMIVVCDTFEYEDYPVYVSAKENVNDVFKAKHGVNMQRVMEIYDLSLDFDKQKMSGRFAWSL